MVLEDEEDEDEDEVEERSSTITTATVRTTRRRKMYDIGAKEVNEGPDKTWREKGV